MDTRYHSLFTLILKAAQFPGNLLPFTPLHCSVLPFFLTQQMRLLPSHLLLYMSRKSRQPLSFSARTSYTSEDLPLFSVLSPRSKELASAQCFLVAYFFWMYDHSCCFPLPVLPWATYLFELECSKLQTAPAEASLMLNTAEGFYMPCTASSTLYNPSMVSCFASLCKATDSC